MRRILFSFILLALAGTFTAEAQRGCCSHHGGVCGCSCCDGTPLSDRCSCGPGGSSPSRPSRLNASALSGFLVALSWDDNSSNETSFRIEKQDEHQVFFQEIKSVGSNVTTAVIDGLMPETLYSFRVRARNGFGDSPYSSEASVRTLAAPVCTPASPCFSGDRFKVEARWQTRDGASGKATAVLLTEDAGTLWFFAASNVEAVFKILDACSLNGSFWFFAGGLTDVQTTITVTDTLTGRMKIYTNPQGTAFRPIQDTSAFPCS